jgi:hypothetical protein
VVAAHATDTFVAVDGTQYAHGRVVERHITSLRRPPGITAAEANQLADALFEPVDRVTTASDAIRGYSQ